MFLYILFLTFYAYALSVCVYVSAILHFPAINFCRVVSV